MGVQKRDVVVQINGNLFSAEGYSVTRKTEKEGIRDLLITLPFPLPNGQCWAGRTRR